MVKHDLIRVSYVWPFVSETCTDFVLLLLETFGERPVSKDLTGVVIDRENIHQINLTAF